MNLQDYRAFTVALQHSLSQDPRVLGLVAVGSMAEQDIAPDRWSDHDFFVITRPGQQEALRADLTWLPNHERIAFWFRESAHGLKVVYADGHLLEYAIFDRAELELAKINRFRVLFDRSNVTEQVEAIRRRSGGQSLRIELGDGQLQVGYQFGQFLTNLMVGVGRYWRGERLSAQQFVKSHALEHLVILLSNYVPANQKALLDNISPLRRFDLVYPELGSELDAIANLSPPQAAMRLLDVAEGILSMRVPDYPFGPVALVRRFLGGAQSHEMESAQLQSE